MEPECKFCFGTGEKYIPPGITVSFTEYPGGGSRRVVEGQCWFPCHCGIKRTSFGGERKSKAATKRYLKAAAALGYQI